jgi:hypothetical protein
MKKLRLGALLAALFIALAGCATTQVGHDGTSYAQQTKQEPVSQADHGGILGLYIYHVKLARELKAKVVIDYTCESACVTKLSSGPGLRVSKDARFGVHEARRTDGGKDYQHAERFERMTTYYKKWIPECAVKLFESRHAFDQGEITTFTGAEVLEACHGTILEHIVAK